MVGIILTTYNLLHKTRACLDSLTRTTRCPHRLVAVDNASHDGTVDFLRARGVETVVNREDVALSRALNQGIRHLLQDERVRHVAWVHNDMLFFPGWLENLVAILAERPNVGKLSPWNWTGNPAQYDDRSAAEFMVRHRGYLEPGNGCPWVMPREVVERVGLFDERYLRCGGYEDWDYNNRVLDRGYQVAITRASVVWHETMGTRGRIEQREAALHNAALYASKWGEGPRV